VELNVWAFVIVIIAIVVDFSRSRALSRVAKKYDSQALEADALHFSTDIWSSLVVLGGLVCVLIAQLAHVDWLAQADAVAALGVSGIVIYVSVQLGKRTISALLDGVPASLRDRLVNAVMVDGVTGVERLRVRQSGPESFVDVCLSAKRDVSLVRAHDIAAAAEDAVRRVLPGADVVVHIDPNHSEHEDTVTTVQVTAGQHNLGAHGIRIYDIAGKRELELHLEVRESLSLAEAHSRTTALEHELRRTIPNVRSILTHIEPADDMTATHRATKANEATILHAVQALPGELGVDCSPHNVHVRRVGDELSLSFHCLLAPSMSLSDVHAFTERAEQKLRANLPDVARIVIHTEPLGPKLP
jgi:divalent metal cation (Fe/Co/Zn/Cd) transporter